MTKICLVGDISINGLYCSDFAKNEKRVAEIVHCLKDQKYVFGNLESPVFGDGEINEEKKILLSTTREVARQILPKLNLNCVSLANNHIYDFKTSGLRNTIDLLEELEIKHTGAGYLKEHVEPVIINSPDGNIGFLAYVDISTNPKIKPSNRVFINYFEPNKAIADIQKLRETCKKIIVSVHWGVDYSFYPTKRQIEISNKLSQAGADIIMGHHTHTLQAWLHRGHSVTFFSLGSLLHGDWERDGERKSLPLKSKTTAIAFVNLENCHVKLQFLKTKPENLVKAIKATVFFRIRQHFLFTLHQKCRIFRWFVRIKENFTDKTTDYFFGYYKNPWKQMLKLLKNRNKIKTALEEYANYKSFK